ncbi:MAG: hypothetical protein IJ809_06850 [Clostridia bacterium]|nr:hypothetical protein [Clostridia bacterium]
MNKIVVIISIAILFCLTLAIFILNNTMLEEKAGLKDNYILSFSVNENNGASQTICKTYYFYNNKDAICETILKNKSTNEAIKTDYEKVSIVDEEFSVLNVLSMLFSASSSMLNNNACRVYVKNTDRTYMILKNSEIYKVITKAINYN